MMTKVLAFHESGDRQVSVTCTVWKNGVETKRCWVYDRRGKRTFQSDDCATHEAALRLFKRLVDDPSYVIR
jgi:hypothetical protein